MGARRTWPAARRHGRVAVRMNGVQVSLQVMVPSKSKSARLLKMHATCRSCHLIESVRQESTGGAGHYLGSSQGHESEWAPACRLLDTSGPERRQAISASASSIEHTFADESSVHWFMPASAP